MRNSFYLYWNKNWTFQIVHMEGGFFIEAIGLGVKLRKPFLATENPLAAADKLVYKEDKNRKSLYSSWNSKEIQIFN